MEQAVSERYPFRLVSSGSVVRVELGTPRQEGLGAGEIWHVMLRPDRQKKLTQETASLWAIVFLFHAGRTPLHKDAVDDICNSLMPGSPLAEIYEAFAEAACSYKASLPAPSPPPAVPELPPAGDAPDAPPVTTDGDAAA